MFANEQRLQYEDEYLQTMNKYRIRGEGEAATGCIRKYHKLQKKRQANFSEEVRRSTRGLRRKYRIRFFRKVLEFVKREQEVANVYISKLASSVDNLAVFPATSNIATFEKLHQEALGDEREDEGEEDSSHVFEEEEDSIFDPKITTAMKNQTMRPKSSGLRKLQLPEEGLFRWTMLSLHDIQLKASANGRPNLVLLTTNRHMHRTFYG